MIELLSAITLGHIFGFIVGAMAVIFCMAVFYAICGFLMILGILAFETWRDFTRGKLK